MKNETPFKVNEVYKTRGGMSRMVVHIADNGKTPIVSVNVTGEAIAEQHTLSGARPGWADHDLIAPEPERRTEWITVHKQYCLTHDRKTEADLCNPRQGNPVPVNLERQPDGNWRVVHELTPTQKAAYVMYDTLNMVYAIGYNQSGLLKVDIERALAKAEGRE